MNFHEACGKSYINVTCENILRSASELDFIINVWKGPEKCDLNFYKSGLNSTKLHELHTSLKYSKRCQ